MVGCNNAETEQKKDERKELGKTVMKIHDEVMPKMDEIYQLQKKLDVVLVEVEADSVLSDAIPMEVVREVLKNLEAANEGMMGWMRGYKYPKDDMAQEEAMKYLNNEKVKIEEVGKNTNDAIAAAKELLEKLSAIKEESQEK